MAFLFYYNLKTAIIKGTKIGTELVRTTPEKNEIIDISEELLLFIIGRRVSIAVAPAVEIDSKLPILFAIIGIVKIASSSLKTLLKKAILPSSALTFESSIADSEYQPSPEETAKLSPTDKGRISPPKKPPKSEPTIVVRGRNQIFFPSFLRLEKTEELSPISIPTKNKRRQRPKSIKESEYICKKLLLEKNPMTTPIKIERHIPIIIYHLFFEKKV